FQTDDYDTRIYAYENDLLYVFSVPAYYYRGSRFYTMVKYSFGKAIDVWLRYSRTLYTNKDYISSGLNKIDSNTKSEIKFMMVVKF
ncbi:MAG: helix-hairpin-helix domain-containing protein, partial [Bacteroidales bacterium]